MELPGPLVPPEWLAGALGRPGLVVADVRWVVQGSARAAFEAGHLPGAGFFDADAHLAGPAVGPGGRHPLPSPEAFAETMAAAGVSDEDAVVCCDDAKGSLAVRLWWMLAVTGHPAGVLDGGLGAWGGQLETGPEVPRQPGRFAARPWPAARIADADEVAATVREGRGAVLDARAAARYRGEVEPFDPVAGHVPGAASAFWEENVDERGRMRDPAELAGRYRALGVTDGDRTIVYCGSGITAVHDALAIEVAGLGRPRVYVGSWSDWVSDPSRPVATGEGR